MCGWMSAGAFGFLFYKANRYLNGWIKLAHDYDDLTKTMLNDLKRANGTLEEGFQDKANDLDKADALAILGMDKENDEHDCHLVGGGGESGCNHPSHKGQPEP